jgi:RNA polymerase sigma-70 factor (ECF subfamily)
MMAWDIGSADVIVIKSFTNNAIIESHFEHTCELPGGLSVYPVGRMDNAAFRKGSVRMGERNVDRELVQRVQKGDKRAFDVLIRKYQFKIIKLISRYVHDPHEAMDVSQEAFLKAYRALPGFRGESAFYTWLYRIAINTAKNYLVAQGRRPPGSDIDAQDAEQYEGQSLLKEYETPERLLLKDEIEATVFKAIEELPEDLRTAITLRELEGMSYEEIAQAMNCPIGTVRSRIFRARESIDAKLRPLLS